MPDLYPETVYQPNYSARVLFAPECKWRLVEEFGMESFKELPDGKLLFAFDFTDMAQLYRWLLTFGDQAELLEPKELREEFRRLGEKLQRKYGN